MCIAWAYIGKKILSKVAQKAFKMQLANSKYFKKNLKTGPTFMGSTDHIRDHEVVYIFYFSE